MRKTKGLTGEAFDRLADAEKERIWQDLDQMTDSEYRSRFRPLSANDRKTFDRVKKKLGRPKIGKGVKVISVGVEQGLLKRADVAAKRRGLNRSALVSEALRAFLGSAA